MRTYALVLTLGLWPFVLAAQEEPFVIPAAAPFFRTAECRCTFNSSCLLAPVTTATCDLLVPWARDKASVISFQRMHQGDLRQWEVSGAYAQSFADRFAFAIDACYVSIGFSDPYYGRVRGAAVSISSFFRPNSKYAVGIVWDNAFGMPYWVDGEQRERLPSGVAVTAVYRGVESLALAVSVEKKRWRDACCIVMVEGVPLERFRWRAGLSAPEFQLAAGAGCMGRRYSCDALCLVRRGWGVSLQVSVSRAVGCDGKWGEWGCAG
ncbi:MAG: hypothetical protein J6Y34_07150 [Bacteroidales bacterium]|nr:hypothetical protein [Bacteroidales bacterium]